VLFMWRALRPVPHGTLSEKLMEEDERNLASMRIELMELREKHKPELIELRKAKIFLIEENKYLECRRVFVVKHVYQFL